MAIAKSEEANDKLAPVSIFLSLPVEQFTTNVHPVLYAFNGHFRAVDMKLVASLLSLATLTSFSRIKCKCCIRSGNAGHPVELFTTQPVSSIILNVILIF